VCGSVSVRQRGQATVAGSVCEVWCGSGEGACVRSAWWRKRLMPARQRGVVCQRSQDTEGARPPDAAASVVIAMQRVYVA